MEGELGQRSSNTVLLPVTAHDFLIFCKGRVELSGVSVIEGCIHLRGTVLENFVGVVECYFHAKHQMAMVVHEVRGAVFAAGLVGRDELVVYVAWRDGLVETLVVLNFPGHVEHPLSFM